MKSRHRFLFFLLFALSYTAQAQIANLYPGDSAIETDSRVVYVEKFDDTMAGILSRYSDIKNSPGMSLDPDVPSGSVGPHSLKMTSITGGVNNGGHLYKRFTPGFDSIIYVRYYVKYPSESKGYFHHEAVWFGGYNPATSWPSPKAGTCGMGSSRLSISFEPVWQNSNPPGMDTYIYWGDMKSYNGTTCYGNTMITLGATGFGQPSSPGNYPEIEYDKWICVEVMIKLNNPVTEYNGEMAIWVDGEQVGHWGPGFPNGHWNKDKWYNNPNDPPFEGFRWRTDDKLNINWLWFEFYHDDPKAPSSYIKFDHLVMANQYIGPIYDASTGTDDKIMAERHPVIYPNPSTGKITVSNGNGKISNIAVYSMSGEKVMSASLKQQTSYTFDLSRYPKSSYLIRIQEGKEFYTQKIILE